MVEKNSFPGENASITDLPPGILYSRVDFPVGDVVWSELSRRRSTLELTFGGGGGWRSNPGEGKSDL